MREITEDNIRTVCDAFQLQGSFLGYERIEKGKVNDTFIVRYQRDDGKQKAYIAQRLNTYVFKKPAHVMSNANAITDHIHQKYPDKKVLHYHYAQKDNPLYHAPDGTVWRLFNYIDNVPIKTPFSLATIKSAGWAYGDFQRCLSDYQADSLYQTIPDFHDTRKRYLTLKTHYEALDCGFRDIVKPEYEALLELEDRACLITDLHEQGRIPLRVTHNDTKIDNVLFGPDGFAIAVVDFDTVMAGLIGDDFGDAIRSVSNVVGSSCPDFEKVMVNMPIFKAFSEGFVPVVKDYLNENERMTLADSCLCLTAELSVRYLDDFITGNKYFKTSYEEQNLVRCRNQLTLANDMVSKMQQMRDIVAALT